MWAVTILLAPATFVASFWFEKRDKFRADAAAMCGLLFLFLGVGVGGIGGFFGEWVGTRQWKGFGAFLSFDPATIGYFSDFVALAYGFLAFSIFRTIFPQRRR